MPKDVMSLCAGMKNFQLANEETIHIIPMKIKLEKDNLNICNILAEVWVRN